MILCPRGRLVEGIDVSHNNGAVDWGAVRASGRGFAFARTSYGTQTTDREIARNWPGIKAAGMTRGSYQFFLPTQDPIAQAELSLRLAPPQAGDLSPAIDVEPPPGGGSWGVSSDAIAQAVLSWVRRVSSAIGGAKPIVYTGAGFWNALPNIGIESLATLWVANWAKCPTIPDRWKGWAFWQYSGDTSAGGGPGARVPGIQVVTDLNVFNGTKTELWLQTLGAKRRIGYGAAAAVALAGVALAVAGAASPPR